MAHLQKKTTGTEHTQNPIDFKSLRLYPGLTLAISLPNGLNEATVL